MMAYHKILLGDTNAKIVRSMSQLIKSLRKDDKQNYQCMGRSKRGADVDLDHCMGQTLKAKRTNQNSGKRIERVSIEAVKK